MEIASCVIECHDHHHKAPQNINGLNSVLPSIVFIIGFTDSVHLLFEMRRKRAVGMERLNAVGAAIREVGDLTTATAMDTLDLSGRFLHIAPDVMTISSGGSWLPIGSTARFVVREAADPTSPELLRLP